MCGRRHLNELSLKDIATDNDALARHSRVRHVAEAYQTG
jgi:hypothetical protein